MATLAGIALLALGSGRQAQAQLAYALIGRAAPDFALHAVIGSNARLSEHRGEVVVLSFWSSRCTPCRSQLAALNRSLATYRSAGLTMFGIGVDDDPVQAREFARSAAVSSTFVRSAVAAMCVADPVMTVAREACAPTPFSMRCVWPWITRTRR